MAQESNKAAIWSIVACALVIIMAIAGTVMYNSINNKVTDTNAKVDKAVDGLNTAVDSLKNLPQANVDSNAIANAVVEQVKADITTQVIGSGSGYEAISINGEYSCKNMYFPRPSDYTSFITNELTKNNYRKLFNEISGIMNIESKSDITSVSVHEIGTCRTNQDPSRGITENRETTQQYTIDVSFHKDGGSDLYKKRFIVTATVDSMSDGLSNGNVELISITPVANNYALP